MPTPSGQHGSATTVVGLGVLLLSSSLGPLATEAARPTQPKPSALSSSLEEEQHEDTARADLDHGLSPGSPCESSRDCKRSYDTCMTKKFENGGKKCRTPFGQPCQSSEHCLSGGVCEKGKCQHEVCCVSDKMEPKIKTNREGTCKTNVFFSSTYFQRLPMECCADSFDEELEEKCEHVPDTVDMLGRCKTYKFCKAFAYCHYWSEDDECEHLKDIDVPHGITIFDHEFTLEDKDQIIAEHLGRFNHILYGHGPSSRHW